MHFHTSVARLSGRIAPPLLACLVAGCAITDDVVGPPASPAASASIAAAPGGSAVASQYVALFVATAASGVSMNDNGDVVGTSYVDTGCGPFCLPPQQTVIWTGGQRIVLPSLPGFSGIYPAAINNQGWIVGLAGVPGTTTRAVLWRPNGTGGYGITDLGALPGNTVAEATGIDNSNRVVGWSTTAFFPPNGSPFLWTATGGMVDLSAQGYPDDKPLAMSPAGTIATSAAWYVLGNPASVTPFATQPIGFFPPGTYATAINDAGVMARFLVTTSSQNLIYLFRHTPGSGWQQLSSVPTGRLTRYGMGSVSPTGDVTATVASTGVIAAGPNGLAQSLAGLIAPSFGTTGVQMAGRMANNGQILASVLIGRSFRLMRLVPSTPCVTNCVRSATVAMQGRFVQDPANPGQCFQGGKMYNQVTVKVKAVTEAGAVISGATVNGRFLDDYWTDRQLAATTNARGVATFTNKGPCGVGAVAFLVDKITAGARTFDRAAGTVTNWVIPQ